MSVGIESGRISRSGIPPKPDLKSDVMADPARGPASPAPARLGPSQAAREGLSSVLKPVQGRQVSYMPSNS